MEIRDQKNQFDSINESKPLNGVHVLLVDDGPDNRLFASELLKIAGARVSVAENGEQAVSKIKNWPREKYDIVLMDIQMPVMDGYSATLAIRSLGYLMPILAFTALSKYEDVARSYQSGFDDHLCKPIGVCDLVKVILRHIQSASVRGKENKEENEKINESYGYHKKALPQTC